MNIQLNGQEFDFTGKTVHDLIQQLALKDQRIALEINKEIISKSTYNDILIKDTDVVEIIKAVGGG
jgi:sulfur carrier protein